MQSEVATQTNIQPAMQQICAVLRAEVLRLTIAADEIESTFGCKEIMRQPEAAFAINVSKRLRDALKEFPACWCDSATREDVLVALDKVFS
jgi:hypothetical protein